MPTILTLRPAEPIRAPEMTQAQVYYATVYPELLQANELCDSALAAIRACRGARAKIKIIGTGSDVLSVVGAADAATAAIRTIDRVFPNLAEGLPAAVAQRSELDPEPTTVAETIAKAFGEEVARAVTALSAQLKALDLVFTAKYGDVLADDVAAFVLATSGVINLVADIIDQLQRLAQVTLDFQRQSVSATK
mgnify:FL=1